MMTLDEKTGYGSGLMVQILTGPCVGRGIDKAVQFDYKRKL